MVLGILKKGKDKNKYVKKGLSRVCKNPGQPFYLKL
jgi:hypothetical protein